MGNFFSKVTTLGCIFSRISAFEFSTVVKEVWTCCFSAKCCLQEEFFWRLADWCPQSQILWPNKDPQYNGRLIVKEMWKQMCCWSIFGCSILFGWVVGKPYLPAELVFDAMGDVDLQVLSWMLHLKSKVGLAAAPHIFLGAREDFYCIIWVTPTLHMWGTVEIPFPDYCLNAQAHGSKYNLGTVAPCDPM